MSSGTSTFVGVRVQGGLLPADLLALLASRTDVDGLSSKDYHLAAGESVSDAANRVWAYLRGAWTAYREALAALPETDMATSLTRERFTLVLLDQLGYGRVPTTGRGGIVVGERSFPVSHTWGNVPIHLLGRVSLDTRTKGVAGAAGASPQSMVQELLNRSDEHLWALLANDSTLRLLHDSTSLVGSAYVEFDLEAIFEGDLFADFLLLYILCHESRLEVRDPEVGPASCWLEQWRQDALDTGSRALNLLRDGVVEALQTLGAGFLTHPDNAALRQQLEDGAITVRDVHEALLRVVYRLLFTFVAEDRGVLLDPTADPIARQRYLDYFSTERLRRISRRRRGGRYSDRWQALTLVWRGLGDEDGLPELGLPGIGGLFDAGQLDFLMDCSLTNAALQSAVRSLSLVREPRSQALRIVDYRNLGAEELGSIYEALLEFIPAWDPATKAYQLTVSSGNQRKDTGTYYTPTSLVESLLDTALDPVLDDAQKSANPEEALLNVTVCDPACGSGHFLVGAARRIAKRVAHIRTGDPEPAPAEVRSAMRDVVGRCIYGVDVNPLAAELAKVSLWMETLDPGRPLAFLDAQIKVGHALVGATPKLLAEGLPDDAFKPIEGDDRRIASALSRQNRAERRAQGSLFDIDIATATEKLGQQVQDVVSAPALSLADVHVQQQRWRTCIDSEAYRRQHLAADAWCAAFVWPKNPGAPAAPTHRTIAALADGEDALNAASRGEVGRLAAEYRFFHWHLEFPHLFPPTPDSDETVNPATGWAGGFSVIINNPPWERVKLQEQEFFASRDPDIATAPNAAARKGLIKALPKTNPTLHAAFGAEKRRAEGISHFMRNSGRYPLTGRGDINTYQVFAEADRNLLAGSGRLGVILPTGIATDATTQYFFKDLVANGSISSLYDFENSKPLFEGVHRSQKFCLLTLVGRDSREPAADFAFFAHDPTDLQRSNARFALTPEEIKLLNPNTGTCPVFRSRRDAEITLGIYRRVPVLIREGDPDGNPWGIRFMTMFHMSNDSHLFHTRDELEADGWTLNGNVFERGKQQMLPLYQGMMATFYNHRAADVVHSSTAAQRQNQPDYLANDDLANPNRLAMPAYWIAATEVTGLPEWLIGFSDITSPTNERTMVAYPLPAVAVGNKVPLVISEQPAPKRSALLALLSSFVFDYVVRQKVGGTTLNFYLVKQFPALGPGQFDIQCPWERKQSLEHWVMERVSELSYTAVDMRPFAVSVGLRREPYVWNAQRRVLVRSELDAAFFHLYGIERDDVDYIMETFPIVKRKDIAENGEYRTKRMILEIYDAMAEAEATGTPYKSPLGGPIMTNKAGTR
ncbi:Eco57I restriction-modification methylase domain-containing protein [Mycobacterium shimoidei]|uniref:Eco57I restriction-modification methylase domain-containing protein n=1 Tax=Mycobacterium shimoidei TaxID=29313 RepID=UPI000848FD66|nr:N-6 DNA methylase [Mycobacterium shimoidei]MCV7261129.1 N-6 DNA methylase [Mycobacterium shimoidei]ODR07209.1 restriction endonuclease [Mycobacterium shimoidei]ORW77394.1 restriction endonuclease [Mycobacterium shimoidei]